MKLCELSEGYSLAAIPIKNRLQLLRQQLRQSTNANERTRLRHEIAYLAAILTQCRELADLTAHYYERGYYRNEKYTL